MIHPLMKLSTYSKCVLYTWGKLLLFVMLAFGPMEEVSAQRILWGVMWNGAAVPIPEVIRYNASPSLPTGSRGVPTVARSEATALIGGWGLHTFTPLYEFNPETSIGLMANPMLAVYYPVNFNRGFTPWDIFDLFDTYGLPVMMQMPLMVHFAHGMLSTTSSIKEIGWGISAGIEGSMLLDRYARLFRNNSRYDVPEMSWVRPVVAAHLRYWTRNDRPRELSFQFSTHQDNYTATGVMRPMFKISYGGYWNY